MYWLFVGFFQNFFLFVLFIKIISDTIVTLQSVRCRLQLNVKQMRTRMLYTRIRWTCCFYSCFHISQHWSVSNQTIFSDEWMNCICRSKQTKSVCYSSRTLSFHYIFLSIQLYPTKSDLLFIRFVKSLRASPTNRTLPFICANFLIFSFTLSLSVRVKLRDV